MKYRPLSYSRGQRLTQTQCIPNSEDPAGPCEACSRVALNYSKKVLHHIPCHRYKLQEVVRKNLSSPFPECFTLGTRSR